MLFDLTERTLAPSHYTPHNAQYMVNLETADEICVTQGGDLRCEVTITISYFEKRSVGSLMAASEVTCGWSRALPKKEVAPEGGNDKDLSFVQRYGARISMCKVK